MLDREEIASSITSWLGTAFSGAALWLLVSEAREHGDMAHLAVFAVFGISLVFVYMASAMMHALRPGRIRRVFEYFDLAGIFFLIAGTYTPLSFAALKGAWGRYLLFSIWALVLIGVTGLLKNRKAFEKSATLVYFLMGWLMLAAIWPLTGRLPAAGLLLLLGGGAAYSVGALVFLWGRFPFFHAAWHGFAMLGSLLHFLLVLLYICPPGGSTVLWP